MSGKQINFLKPVVKIGDSYCIRIPKNVIDYLQVTEGDVLEIIARNPQEEKLPRKLLMPYKKHLPELKDYSLDLINSCLFIFGIENSFEDKEKKKDFENVIKEEKGEDFLMKYKLFKEAIIKHPEAMKRVLEECIKSSKDFRKSVEVTGIK
jgi:bifunctional DNA-binding transcriptional regulator/antitoxin component of YhaV-PrlF toxin-antitoxin module